MQDNASDNGGMMFLFFYFLIIPGLEPQSAPPPPPPMSRLQTLVIRDSVETEATKGPAIERETRQLLSTLQLFT